MPKLLKRHLFESVQNLWLYKLRSLLTILGVLVGTASVVALVSSGQLATRHALDQFKNLGTDLFAVTLENQPGDTTTEQAPKLDLNDVEKIAHSIPEIVSSAPYTSDYSQVSYGGKPISGNIIGATETLAVIIKIETDSGRQISTLDKQQYFCMVGSDIAQDMKNSGSLNPIGEQIRVGDRFFTIVGVAKPWPENMFMYANINRAVIIPIETSFNLSKYVRIQNILFKLKPDSDVNSIQPKIEQAINQILPNIKLFSRSAKELIGSMQKQRQTFTLMLGSIGGISLLVGGIGVMNIMLVSVMERRREIGIRLAIGAQKHDIQAMFLTDAVVLTLFGGLLGVIVGELVSLIIAIVSHWRFSLFATPLIIGFTVSVLVGIFFGYYPAYKASQLDPIQTLRSE
ncbi:MAG TPA: ABC transporter permease [Gammaproteobacteria bacterium]|nr:ABC transporter permease [Gammaproteobacteria bacterium]